MLHVKTMLGLGDAFAARPTIAALARRDLMLGVETPWPEAFAGIGDLVFIKPSNLNIRCAKRNVEESKVAWVDAQTGAKRIQLSYSLHKGCKSIPEQIAESAGVLDLVEWDALFMMPTHHTRSMSPLGVFRVPTIRTEYKNSARNPFPGLVAAAVDEIGGDFIHLNSICDSEKLDEDEFRRYRMSENRVPEKAHGGLLVETGEYASASSGELSIPACLDLVSRARACVTPISWMAWAAMAYQVPSLIVWGGYASPDTIMGPIRKLLPLCVKMVVPDAECWCFSPVHQCDKSIPIDALRQAARSLK